MGVASAKLLRALRGADGVSRVQPYGKTVQDHASKIGIRDAVDERGSKSLRTPFNGDNDTVLAMFRTPTALMPAAEHQKSVSP